MSLYLTGFSGMHVQPAGSVLHSTLGSWNQTSGRHTEQPSPVFVTVNRQLGAGAVSFSHRLAARLNELGTNQWSAWDRELMEKVSTEFRISRQILDSIRLAHHNWLRDLLEGLAISKPPPNVEEIRAYRRVVTTIRALAASGHVIIVGMCGTFITEGMPAAIHLRLVAPLEYRIKSTAGQEGISLHEAAAKIATIDQRRLEFNRRYWHRKAIAPEAFTMTLNSAEMSLDELVDCVVPLIRKREVAAKDLKLSNPREPTGVETAVAL
jgi:cytidylate kinase